MASGNSCVCKPGTKCTQDSDCSWGPSDIDCPTDPNNVELMNCFGFAFTMPPNYEAPAQPLPPPDNLFVPFTNDDYFMENFVFFQKGAKISPNDTCAYTNLPMQ